MKEEIIRVLKRTLEVLASSTNIDERQLNSALYELICYNDFGTIRNRLDNYYNVVKIDDIAKLQFTIRKKTNYILDAIKQDVQELHIFEDKEKEELDFGYEDALILDIINSNNLRHARRNYLHATSKIREIGRKTKFDFDIYREIYSVSYPNDMFRINGNDTKLIVLKVLFYKYVHEIFNGIYTKLEEFGIIESGSFQIRTIKEISSQISEITAICLSNNNTKTKVIDNADKTKMLKEYCRFKQGRNAIEELINILEDLKDRFAIYPNTCNKKKFAEIVYILYRFQWYIGMKTDAIKTYKKFMRLMCLYYDYPETTYKINDIKDGAMKLMTNDFYFKDFKTHSS